MLHAEFSNYPEKVNNKNELSKFRQMQKVEFEIQLTFSL